MNKQAKEKLDIEILQKGVLQKENCFKPKQKIIEKESEKQHR